MLHVAQQSHAQRVHPSVRILSLLALSVAAFLCPGPAGVGLLAILIAVLSAVCLVTPRQLGRLMIPAVPFVFMALLFGAFSYDPAAGMVMTSASMARAALTAFRLLVLFAASALFCLTSTSEQQMTGLRTLLLPLGKLGLPVDDVATTLSLALRFIPLTLEQLSKVRAAQSSRGAKLRSGSVFERLRANAGCFAPLFVGMFRRASTLALAMDARCYGGTPQRTCLVAWRLGGADLAFGLMVLAVCGVALVL